MCSTEPTIFSSCVSFVFWLLVWGVLISVLNIVCPLCYSLQFRLFYCLWFSHLNIHLVVATLGCCSGLRSYCSFLTVFGLNFVFNYSYCLAPHTRGTCIFDIGNNSLHCTPASFRVSHHTGAYSNGVDIPLAYSWVQSKLTSKSMRCRAYRGFC